MELSQQHSPNRLDCLIYEMSKEFALQHLDQNELANPNLVGSQLKISSLLSDI